MEGCSKTSAGAVSGIPDDPLVDILSRVPAKSVCRFKCVSKAWRDLIDDPHNRKKLRQAMQGLFAQMPEINKSLVQTYSFNFVDLTVRSVPLDMDPCLSFLTELTRIQNLRLLDSCNGLILFRHYFAGGYIVCNPTTKQWSAVPACDSPVPYHQTDAKLAFDLATSYHFHLVQLQFQGPSSNAKVLSLHVYSSETGTWSQNQIDEQNEQGQLEGWHHQFGLVVAMKPLCAFVNGFLHFVVWGVDGYHILVADVQGKARRMITMPCMADFICYLGQSQGHLHCVILKSADVKNEKLSVWALQNYNTHEWVLKKSVNSLDIFGERLRPKYFVVDIHQDCNVLFFFHQLTCELIAYDMNREEVSVLATFQDYKFPGKFARYVPYFLESPALTNKQ